MLINVSGSYGTYKTTFLVFLVKELPQIDFKSNFGIRLPNVEKLDLKLLITEQYENCVILLDEAYHYLESRTSAKNLNVLLSRVLFQSRKAGLDIITTEQIENTIDCRFRDLCDLQIICNVRFKKCKFTFLTDIKEKTITILQEKMAKYFAYFDTKEKVKHIDDYSLILDTLRSPEEKEDYSKEIAMNIYALIKKPTISEIRAYFTKYNIQKKYFDLVKLELQKLKKSNGKSEIGNFLFDKEEKG